MPIFKNILLQATTIPVIIWSFSDTIQKGTILHKKYSNMGLSFITQLLSGENAGILWHRSRMTRIMTTHD